MPSTRAISRSTAARMVARSRVTSDGTARGLRGRAACRPGRAGQCASCLKCAGPRVLRLHHRQTCNVRIGLVRARFFFAFAVELERRCGMAGSHIAGRAPLPGRYRPVSGILLKEWPAPGLAIAILEQV